MGEAAAAAYLGRQGYQLLASNYRCPLGELDLVAHDTSTRQLVFVEVRTCASRSFGLPEESITSTKAARLTRLAMHYLQEQAAHARQHSAGWRIDVIAIEVGASGDVLRLDHYKHAIERA